MARYKYLVILGIVASLVCLSALLGLSSGARKPRSVFDDADVASLAEAAKSGDCEQIDRLVARKVDLNARGKGGITPLLYSMDAGDTKGFEHLLVCGADPNLEDDWGEAAIHRAAIQQRSEFLKIALAHGGDPNLRCHITVAPKPGETPGTVVRLNLSPTPIFRAVLSRNLENVRILIKASADLNAREGEFGNTPLMCAASAHAFDAMLVLLEAGADFRLKDNLGYPVSHFFTADYDNIDPKSPVAAARQRCREFMEKRGVDFKKEKIENEKTFQKIQEGVKQEEAKINDGLKQEKKMKPGASRT